MWHPGRQSRRWPISTVLVTGGAGFIGSELAPLLLQAGHHVVAVDVLHPQVHPHRRRPGRLPTDVELVVADVTEPATWDDLLPRVTPDVVVHLAAETGTGQSLTEATRHAHVNVVGSTALLDALLRHDSVPEQLLLASSRAVYGEGCWRAADGAVFSPGPRSHAMLGSGDWDPRGVDGSVAVPLDSRAGQTIPEPTSVYGATKLAQEHVFRAWAAASGAALSVLRLQNVYGPGQSLTNSYTGIVALFARMTKAGETVELYEDGRVVRDFVHVDDVVRALAAALARPVPHRLVDVGSGVPTTILELAQLLADLHGAPPPRVSGRFRDGDVRHASTEVTAMTGDLGVRPEVSLPVGLQGLSRWIDASTGTP